MIAFDTNVLVRLVVEDDSKQFELANGWLRRCEAEGEPCLIKSLVLCETLWVLRSVYKASRFELALLIETLLTDDVFIVEESETVRDALARFRQGRADFADYLIGVNSRALGASSALTFDAGLQGEESFTWLDSSERDEAEA